MMYRVEELNEKGSADISIAIVGNKVDLEEPHEVTRQEAEAYTQ